MNAKALALTSALAAVVGLAHASRVEAEGSTASRPVAGGHVQDDYAEALAQARRRHVPIVVDVWAPW